MPMVAEHASGAAPTGMQDDRSPPVQGLAHRHAEAGMSAAPVQIELCWRDFLDHALAAYQLSRELRKAVPA